MQADPTFHILPIAPIEVEWASIAAIVVFKFSIATGWRSATMKLRPPAKQLVTGVFDIVRNVGLALPDVEATTKYDGSPVLKVDGIFMAGLATHPSAEPGTLVVRAGLEDRERLVEDAPETYYLTDYYRSYPLVLVRLSHVEPNALHDLLSVSRRMTMAKARKRRSPPGF